MRIFYIIILLIGLTQEGFSQIFPVQVNTQLLPPYTPYLSDYTAPGAQKFMVQLRVNDPTLSEYTCKLRITIEGVNITIRTKPTFIPQPIRLQGGGIPETFFGEDLIEYFNPNNLDFSGFSRREYEKGARLPEGVYRFTVEVVDYNRNVVVSNKGTTIAWIILNDPPLLNLPRRETKVPILDPTNIVFTWTPRHTGSPNAAFSTEYVFRLVEIWPANRNPYDAFLSQQPLYEVTTDRTQILYGPAEPALIPGRKYAWQVQAKDTDNRDLFKNQGRSEVFVFQFGDEIGMPENFRHEGGNESTLSVRWEPSVNGEMPEQYRVKYKEINTNTWYETVTTERWSTLSSLKPNTQYDIQVRAEKKHLHSAFTPIQQVRTKEKLESDFSCGQTPVIAQADNSGSLAVLRPGEEFRCGDFMVVVLEVTDARNGFFSGVGMMGIRLLKDANIGVVFSGNINDKYVLTTGGVKTIYNQGSAMSQAVDKMRTIGEDKPKLSEGDSDSTNISPPTDSIVISGIIDSVYVNAETNEIVVVADGKETTYKQPVNETTKEAVPVTVTDSAGNSYTVDKDGKVSKGNNASGTAGNPVVASKLDDFGKLLRSVLLEIKGVDSIKIIGSSDSLNTSIRNQLEVLNKSSESSGGNSSGFRVGITKDFTDTETLSISEVNAMKQDSDLKILMESVETQDHLYSKIMANWKRMKVVENYLSESNFHTLSKDIKEKLTEQKADLTDLSKLKPSITSLVNEKMLIDAN